eukprot:scaffold41864_cov54-Phaeocystis_antarctica.AAC.1
MALATGGGEAAVSGAMHARGFRGGAMHVKMGAAGDAVTDDGVVAKLRRSCEARGVLRWRQLEELECGLVRRQLGALQKLAERVLWARDVGGAVRCEALSLIDGHDEEVDIDCGG